ncbi:MAG: PepSY domain-containing protein [Planctomycetota bacterium]
MRALLIACVILLCVSCESDREPLSRARVMAVATNRVEHLRLDWGAARQAVPPDAPDPETGRLYWQVYFEPAPDGDERVMLVNPYSGWARPAPPDQPLRTMLYPVSPEQVARRAPVRGSWILVLDTVTPEQQPADWSEEVQRLNHLALETRLYPLFSIRRARDGTVQLIYGWYEEGGIPRLDGIADWVTLRTDYQDLSWIDLAQGP